MRLLFSTLDLNLLQPFASRGTDGWTTTDCVMVVARLYQALNSSRCQDVLK